MEPLSKQRIIEMAKKQLIARNEARVIKDIRVEPAKRLMMNSEPGWKVFCIFHSEDALLHKALIFEVSAAGDMHLLERM
jgi:hypothetical protein